MIKTDYFRLRIVLQNLLTNATKFKKPDYKAIIEICFEREFNNYRLTISDNGESIPREFIPDIFDMFYRASNNSKGSGLGLYIVKKMITKMIGQIEVDSQPGIGTTLSIILPLQSEL